MEFQRERTHLRIILLGLHHHSDHRRYSSSDDRCRAPYRPGHLRHICIDLTDTISGQNGRSGSTGDLENPRRSLRRCPLSSSSRTDELLGTTFRANHLDWNSLLWESHRHFSYHGSMWAHLTISWLGMDLLPVRNDWSDLVLLLDLEGLRESIQRSYHFG